MINAKIPDGDDYNDRIAVVKLLVNCERIHDAENEKYIWQGVEVAKGDYRNGGFTINLPDNIDNLKPFDFDLPPKIKMSKENVMFANADLIAYNENDEQVGYFLYGHVFFCNETVAFGELLYFDRDFTIVGSDTEIKENYTLDSSASCKFKKGWNFLYDYGVNANPKRNYTSKITTSEPDCMYWNFRTSDIY